MTLLEKHRLINLAKEYLQLTKELGWIDLKVTNVRKQLLDAAVLADENELDLGSIRISCKKTSRDSFSLNEAQKNLSEDILSKINPYINTTEFYQLRVKRKVRK